MINRFKWRVCCLLVLIMSFVLSPNSANSAALLPSDDTKPIPVPLKETLIKNIPPQASDSVSPRLLVVNTAGREIVTPGEFLNYDLTVTNTARESVPGVRLLELMPVGLKLKKGSVLLNGVSTPDPSISTNGRISTFIVGDLAPGSSSTISFIVEVAADSKPGKVVTIASAISSVGGGSNMAKVVLTIKEFLPKTNVEANIIPTTTLEPSQAVAVKDSGAKPLAVTIALPIAEVSSQKATTATALSPQSMPLRVVNTSGREIITPGEFLSYDLSVTNTTRESVPGVRLLDLLPVGFRLKKGSVLLNGVSTPDSTISTNGKIISVTVGELAPGTSSTISFMVEVSADSKPGKVVAIASAISSAGGGSNLAKVVGTVRDASAHAKTEAIIIPSTVLDTPKDMAVKNSPVVTPQVAAIDLPVKEASSQNSTPPPTDLSSQSVPPQKTVDVNPKVDGVVINEFTVPESRNLADLIGKSEITVLSDVDGQFVKNMAENQVLDNEYAGLVGETSLFDSLNTGRSFNRESRAALARTEQAKAQTGQAFALLLPSVSMRFSSGLEISNPSSTADKSADTHSRTDAALTVRQPLFDLPSLMDWRRRKIIEQVRGESYRVSDSDAYLSTANAYLTMVSSRLQTDMTREFEVQLTELSSYIEKRASAGAASVSDMARVRARRQATLSSRLEQESAHAAAGIEFVRLTNLVPRKVRLPELEGLGASLLPKSLDMAVKTAMKSNPEIASLNAEIMAAKIDQSAAKDRYLPRVDAEYTNNFSLHAGGDPSSSGQKDQRIMAVLNWSLFSGGSDYNTHIERAARHKELQYRLDDQRRRVVQTLSANYATLSTTRERITSGYQELKSISTAADAMSKRMLSGNQSLLDLLDVYDRFYQIRSRLVSLHILEMSTVAQLVRLTFGTPDAGYEVKTEPVK